MFLSSMEQVGSVLDFSFFPFQPKKVRLFWFIFTVHHLINKFVYIFNLTIWFIKTIFFHFSHQSGPNACPTAMEQSAMLTCCNKA